MKRNLSWLGVALVFLVLGLVGWLERSEVQTGTVGGAPDDRVIETLFHDRESGVVVESAGIVTRTLPDDNEGSRHQRWILELASGHTVLISHNIDLAERVPLSGGDTVEFRGQYEWNERGGVVHWTHHDPRNRRPGGWIRHRGQRYR